MVLRQSKRPLTFPPRPLGDMFCKSESLIQSGTHILSYCDDSFARKSCPPIRTVQVPGRTLPISAALIRQLQDEPQRRIALIQLWGVGLLEERMKRLRRIAIISTTVSALTLFLVANTGLALPPIDARGTRPPCYPLFELPFTDYFFRLPLWMWGFSLWTFLISTLAAIGCWVA